MSVDDDDDLRFMLKRMLKKAGYDVITAESGEKALEILKEQKPDAILLDVMMPNMDGWETLEAIRKNPDTTNIPAIMVSVKGEEEDRQRSFDSRADGHVSKPIIKEKLLFTIDWVLKNVVRRG